LATALRVSRRASLLRSLRFFHATVVPQIL